MEESSEAVAEKTTQGEEGVHPPKEYRQRKKRLLRQVAEQMEFYFSSANVSKDHFMTSLLESSPYIDLQTFFKFNKLRSLTNDIDFLRKAIATKSSLLELSEDGLKVKRKTEIEVKEDELQCTIYVENIPSHVDHSWVRQVFGQYGSIDYVSLPRYRRSGRPKGFAFVEFKTPQMANSALEAFGALECRISSTADPAELQSIKTFEGDMGEESGEQDQETLVEPASFAGQVEEEGKDHVTAAQDGVEEGKRRKRKLEDVSSEGSFEKKRKEAQKGEEESERLAFQSEEGADPSVSGEPHAAGSDNADMEEEPSSTGKKKKKKRKRNKKEKEVLDSIYLRVMSKEDWKKLRNKYLNAQRENMKYLKFQLQDRHHSHYKEHADNWNTDLDDVFDQVPDSSQERENKVTNTQGVKPQFIANAILKISFEEPPQDPKKLRETIREGGGGGVAYVDVCATERDVFVRFLSEDAAAAYKKTGCWSRMEILSGAEEEEYWKRIVSCWSQRRRRKNKEDGNRVLAYPCELRGRDKLLQKAFRESQNTKPSSHIIFDD